MNGNPGTFAEIYRAALAERDPERKQVLLRRVRDLLDLWAQSGYAAQSDSEPNLAVSTAATAEKRMAARGEYERSLPSVA